MNLVKLAVGIASIDHLKQRQAGLMARNGRLVHTTRMVPKRKNEIMLGGSIYWVIKGHIQARQLITDIEIFKDEDGVRKCHLVLEPDLHLTKPYPKRAFQGWRYLPPADTPQDDLYGGQVADMPQAMRQDLISLGLL